MRLVLLSLLLCAASLDAQPRPDLTAHKAAMAKLNFLAGNWSGEATITRGANNVFKIRQTERVEYKLDGMVLLIEGTGRDETGKVVFNAFATVAYDPTSRTYRIRAYREANYVDAELKLLDKGFEWSYPSGPVTITNHMVIDANGKWSETTDGRVGEGRHFRAVEMLLSRE